MKLDGILKMIFFGQLAGGEEESDGDDPSEVSLSEVLNDELADDSSDWDEGSSDAEEEEDDIDEESDEDGDVSGKKKEGDAEGAAPAKEEEAADAEAEVEDDDEEEDGKLWKGRWLNYSSPSTDSVCLFLPEESETRGKKRKHDD